MPKRTKPCLSRKKNSLHQAASHFLRACAQKALPALLALMLWPQHPAPLAAALDAYQPGFRTVGAWRNEPEMRLDLNIWYPTRRQPRNLGYAPWTISAALNAKPAEGVFPLLLISHATPGMRFSYHDLAAELASRGFIVAAPTHGHDSMNNMDDLFTWRQLETRAKELAAAIELAGKELGQSMDRNRAGIIGFGSGGTAALLLGGAMPDCATWDAYRANAGPADPYANTWAKEKIDSLCQNFPLAASMEIPAVKAVAAIAPGFGMIFSKNSFQKFHTPLLLVAAGRDSINRAELHCEPLARIMGKKARYLDLPDADTGALMAECPRTMEAELPELCRSITRKERQQLHKKLADALASFFSSHLRDAGDIPAAGPDFQDLER